MKFLSLISLFAALTLQVKALEIDIWYGDEQSFGHLGGHPQRWVNVLGDVSPASEIQSLTYSLNDGEAHPLSFKEDHKRIAKDGDFNVEILRSLLKGGKNQVLITALDAQGRRAQRRVVVEYHQNEEEWPLPYTIDWSKVSDISEVAQIVDGKWELTSDGVRTVERYYDRVIAFGDNSWENYEVQTTVIIHALTGPKEPPNTTNVTHVAIATRWPGHEADGQQPTVKWHPLGATAEYRLGKDLTNTRWRVFDGQRKYHVESERRRDLEFEKPYHMKHRVQTLPNGLTHYQVKLWAVDVEEPPKWDFERFEPGDLRSGSALLLAHHSDATFGDVTVVPID